MMINHSYSEATVPVKEATQQHHPHRVHNFCAGPAALPLPVLRQVQQELLSYGSVTNYPFNNIDDDGVASTDGCGYSILEMSHRSRTFDTVLHNAEANLRALLELKDDDYDVVFMQGGGTAQFSAVPLNAFPIAQQKHGNLPVKACYIVTGAWSKKASEEAIALLGKENVHIICNGKSSNYTCVPPIHEWDLPYPWCRDRDKDKTASSSTPMWRPAYIYYCANETIQGIEMPDSFPHAVFPQQSGSDTEVPIIADFSSNFLSKPLPHLRQHHLIFAAAQKNFGPAGVSVVLIHKSILTASANLDPKSTSSASSSPSSSQKWRPSAPAILDYKLHITSRSMHNTPPTFAIYVCGLVFAWILGSTCTCSDTSITTNNSNSNILFEHDVVASGLEAMGALNAAKASKLYAAIDASQGFYICRVSDVAMRSRMNVIFRIAKLNPSSLSTSALGSDSDDPCVSRLPSLPLSAGGVDTDAEAHFLERAEWRGLLQLAGHRSVGGIRASLYNAVPMEAVDALVTFMWEFMHEARSQK